MSSDRATNALDINIGKMVRTRRLEIGMSQEKLSDLLGVTFQQVQKYEKGINRIAASRLYDISVALTMPIATFFPPQGDLADAEPSPARRMLSSPEAMQMLTVMEGLPMHDQRRLLGIARSFAEPTSEPRPLSRSAEHVTA